MEHKVTLRPTEGTFRGLASQNMLFHQCVCELVDNAIAATDPKEKFHVEIIFLPDETDSESFNMFVADDGAGMTLEHLQNALQLGESATTTSRLNEHGFGLKNSLATLSGANGPWKIWTKAKAGGSVCSVEGPFRPEMTVSDNDSFPKFVGLPTNFSISTLIRVKVTKRFMQTLQGRGAPATNIATLSSWLIEHLGVLYRGYLEQDPTTHTESGVIVVSIGGVREKVPPILVPFITVETFRFKVDLGQKFYELEYRSGTLDEVQRDSLVSGKSARFYYQGNQPTQGIDIRLGKRVIATRQFETIWKVKKKNGESEPLSRHNNYNEFVGELLIPELPRGILRTTNTKSDFNLDDAEWAKIFAVLDEQKRPNPNPREHSEADLRKQWVTRIKQTSAEDDVSDEKYVWGAGARIDVFRKTAAGKIEIYELKIGAGAPLHLYQLKMYWDGLVVQGVYPDVAILLVEEFKTTLDEMAKQMNAMDPPGDSKPYNFKIQLLSDKGLLKAK